MNEVDKFFEGLPVGNNGAQAPSPIGENSTPAAQAGEVPAKGEGEEGESDVRKNRRHRRLEDQLQRERDSNIALNERIRTLTELKFDPLANSAPGAMPPEWVALHGDTPESQRAWAIQESLILRVKNEAKEEALSEFQQQQQAVYEEERGYETFIDSELESLEDAYGVDLTSDAPSARKARRELLEMVQQVSPKDQYGNITAFADFDSVYEMQSKAKVADSTSARQKEIAGRSMQETSRNTGVPTPQVTPGFRGWMRDFGVDNIN